MTDRNRGQGWTPLMYAAAAGDLAAARMLIDHNADVNARDPETGNAVGPNFDVPIKLQPIKRDGSMAQPPPERVEP